jgi:hypothetical protein
MAIKAILILPTAQILSGFKIRRRVGEKGSASGLESQVQFQNAG